MIDRFDDPGLTFDAASHSYHWEGWPLVSVTTFLKGLHEQFDADRHSARVAARRGCPQSDVLAEWEVKRRRAADMGTAVHAAAENIAKSIVATRQFVAAVPPGLSAAGASRVRAVHSFYTDHIELADRPLWPEVRICHPTWGLAGTVDLICSLEGVSAILDWKTSGSIDFHGYGRMAPPLESLDDCNFIHYALQLSLYAAMLRDRYQYDAKLLALVHLRQNTYELILVNEMDWAVSAVLDAHARRM